MRNLAKLARDGGTPIRKTMLPYSRQVVDEDDIRAVSEALRGDLITRGPFVERFEKEVATFVEMPHGVAFSSATAALHAVMAMLKVNAETKVITSPITFAATANAVRYCNGELHFRDVEMPTMNLRPDAETFKPADIVVAVDFAGNPCRYDELRELQKSQGWTLVDDASHSLGGSYKKKHIGSQADISIFSFHPVKSMTTGEGGLVVVRDLAQAEFLRQFRSHGITRKANIPGFYEQEFLGFNYNITDLQCALGLNQLKKLPRFVERRNQIAQMYHERLAKFPQLILPAVTEGCRSAWHLYPLRLRFDQLKISREDFLRALHCENIGANVHYIPVYFHPYYKDLGYPRGLCPEAEKAYFQEISIPNFASMTDDDVSDVCLALEKLISAC